MNGFFLIIPLIVIRFGLLGLLDKQALGRAAVFAPVAGAEKTAALYYQLSNILIFIYPFFLKISAVSHWSYAGLVVYALGIFLCAVAVLHFAKPAKNGLNLKGVYQLSRNPMYVAYFVYFLGCVLLTQSLILFVVLVVFQVSAHWIILSEERWCINHFGEEYKNYMKKVRRYI